MGKETAPDMKPSISAPSGELALLLRMLDEGYDKKAWHGPNLKGSIRGLTAVEAAWRPHPNRHSIAENVAHCAYWKYAVRRRLRGDKRGAFPLKGSNWFVLADPLSESTWRELAALLQDQHRLLRAEVASFPIARLYDVPAGGKVPYVSQLVGIAAHDVYHAGQIQLLKRLHAVSR
jgi:hypothetical protein